MWVKSENYPKKEDLFWKRYDISTPNETFRKKLKKGRRENINNLFKFDQMENRYI